MNTEALAKDLGIKGQSIRARLCRTGSYYGERPITLPNGRLDWDNGAPQRLRAATARTEQKSTESERTASGERATA